MSTNPFASALEPQTTQQQQEGQDGYKAPPTNPFIASAQQDGISSSHFVDNSRSPSGRADASRDTTMVAPNDTHRLPPHQGQQSFLLSGGAAVSSNQPGGGTHSASATNESNTMKTDEVSSDLAGLHFDENGSTLPVQSDAQALSLNEPTSPNLDQDGRNLEQTNAVQQPQSGELIPNLYAPPPGPPPGPPFGNETDFPPPQLASGNLGGSASPNHLSEAPAVDQMAADEAYARQILASDQERSQRRRDRRQRSERRGDRNEYPTSSPVIGHQSSAAAMQPKIASVTNSNGLPQAPRGDVNEEKQWNTKDVFWKGRSQRIIVQNENGPCSLIALCNVLLLRGTLSITPEDRPAVSYSYLSSLLAEHLIEVISSKEDSALDLEAALSILPQTQHGLDVNVRFSSIDGFSIGEQNPMEEPLIQAEGSSSALQHPAKRSETDTEKQRGELALFKLCNVPLVHGWVADKDDKETYAAVAERAGDYDRALDRVVAGDELAKGMIVEGERATPQAATSSGFRMEDLTPEQAQVVNDAMLIRNFLESTATQLTYHGLYMLSTTLERGVPYALFRNSHLSVVYRPLEEELSTNLSVDPSRPAPQLYQLVTDSTLETEDNVVWESLEDVDGSASRFFDAKFQEAKVTEDFVGRTYNRRHQYRQQQQQHEDEDFALAQHLQEEERNRARQRRQRRGDRGQEGRQFQGAGMATPRRNHASSRPQGFSESNAISRMLASRKTNKRAPSSAHRQSTPQTSIDDSVAYGMGGQPTSSSRQSAQAQAAQAQMRADLGIEQEGQGTNSKKKKWWKLF